jgi:hypothetical protein
MGYTISGNDIHSLPWKIHPFFIGKPGKPSISIRAISMNGLPFYVIFWNSFILASGEII